mgnify:CR=1 FL=1
MIILSKNRVFKIFFQNTNFSKILTLLFYNNGFLYIKVQEVSGNLASKTSKNI